MWLLSNQSKLKLKLFFTSLRLERLLILLKLVFIIVINQPKIRADSDIQSQLFMSGYQQLVNTTFRPMETIGLSPMGSQLKTGLDSVLQLAETAGFEAFSYELTQFAASARSAQCLSFDCLQSLNSQGELFDKDLLPTSPSLCLHADCAEFAPIDLFAKAQRDLDTYLGVKVTIGYAVGGAVEGRAQLIDNIQRLIDNNWIGPDTQRLALTLVYRSRRRAGLYLFSAVPVELMDGVFDKGRASLKQHYWSDDAAYLYLVLLLVVLLAMVKPTIEWGVSPNKLIYYLSFYSKLLWVVYCAVGAYKSFTLERRILLTSHISVTNLDELNTLENVSGFLFLLLMLTVPFELLKLIKIFSAFEGFLSIFSCIYASGLSMVSFIVMIGVMYLSLFLACFVHMGISINQPPYVLLLTLMHNEFTDDFEMQQFTQIVVLRTVRYILWIYFIAVWIFYFRLVSTHIIEGFEPKYYTNISEKISQMSKGIEHFLVKYTVRQSNTLGSKGKKTLIWLTFKEASGDQTRSNFSEEIAQMLDFVQASGVSTSFFSEFEDVILFIKAIYNIIPKLIMSSKKSFRIVVFLGASVISHSSELELELFMKLNKLNQYLEKSGLDTELLLFSEKDHDISRSKLCQLSETVFPRLRGSSDIKTLRHFCSMKNIEAVYNNVDEIEERNTILGDL